MALGDIEDFRKRLRKLIPYSWFPNPSPILWGLISGPAYVLSASYQLFKYAKAQMRMATASDAFLDIAAMDYCGTRIQRRPGELDIAFRERVIEEVLRIRQTRQAIIAALAELTGQIPQVFSPWNTADLGALNYSIFLAGGPFAGVGALSSTAMPFTIFINAYRPLPESGLAVSDAEIYSMVSNVKAAGITAWVNIQGN